MSRRNPWFSIQARSGGSADISILSAIGEDFDGGLSAADFHTQLKALGNPSRLNILISSPGGDISTGYSLYAMLSRHPARKVVTIVGVAASMASVLAMIGDEIVIDQNAMFMIHRPFGQALGEASAIVSFGEALEKMESMIVDSYMTRAKMTRAEIEAAMAAETWYTADEAVKLGFADRVIQAQRMAAHFAPDAFKRFGNVPARAAAMLNNGVNRPEPDPLAATYDKAYPRSAKRSKPTSWDALQQRAFENFNRPAKRSEDHGGDSA